jgi:membrane fusion protein (multidrug efflux system)
MAIDFVRTVRSLEREPARSRALVGLVTFFFLGALGAWFVFASVDVYEVSPRARLENARQASPVVALIDGHVAANHLRLGERVTAGDLLVMLDDRAQALALATGRERLAALEELARRFETEIAAERAALATAGGAFEAAEEEQKRRIEHAAAQLAWFDSRARRLKALFEKRSVSAIEFEQAESDAKVARLHVAALEAGATRLAAEHALKKSDRQTYVANLERERDENRVAIEEQAARNAQLEFELLRCRVEAVESGLVAHVGDYPPGAAVSAKTPLASIVPESRVRVVAQFPSAGAGRIRPGQRGRVRLEGYPWVQYGSLPGRVARVASEAQQGFLRVELEIDPPAGSLIPIEHGLPGTVEVAVEQVSPAVLVLRVIGRMLAASPAGLPDGDAPQPLPEAQRPP